MISTRDIFNPSKDGADLCWNTSIVLLDILNLLDKAFALSASYRREVDGWLLLFLCLESRAITDKGTTAV